jgi:predicted aspartyl protease
MTLRKILLVLSSVTFMVWAVEILYIIRENKLQPDRIIAVETSKRVQATYEFQKRIRDLEEEYNSRKYLATGQSVFERIHNTQEQNIIELIQRIATEALPDSWSSEVRVEEFIHFILLIFLPHNTLKASTNQVILYLQPIIEYCGWLLTDIAVFDRAHKSYLFFDTHSKDEIRRTGELSKKSLARAEKQGLAFTRFNSTTVVCEKIDSQLFVPIEVMGQDGIVTGPAMVDTGASTTMLNYEVIVETGSDDLIKAPRRKFNTANGTADYPIVTRVVSIAGVAKTIEIAVNQKDEWNLLGVNYFEGMDYILDFQNSKIYFWEK